MERYVKFVESYIQLLFKNQFGQLLGIFKINGNRYDLISSYKIFVNLTAPCFLFL